MYEAVLVENLLVVSGQVPIDGKIKKNRGGGAR